MKNIKFITAGAGSGKTFTLTKELVARMKGGLQPDQIILTTFTKAAAEEFKQKAAKALMEAGKKTEAQQLAGAMIGTIDSVA
ncbi:MAG: UvrD-helicase domain-containing protein, partial [Bacteroidales bacterium]|nr:UvrD-helicase domain-containing protein [Bacteroidales bacterium]